MTKCYKCGNEIDGLMISDYHHSGVRVFHFGDCPPQMTTHYSKLPVPNTQMTTDEVNKPPHYTHGKIEVIDAIEDWKLGFHEGNIVKYLARAKHKGNELKDLKKAKWYLERAIEAIERKEDVDNSEIISELIGMGASIIPGLSTSSSVSLQEKLDKLYQEQLKENSSAAGWQVVNELI